MIKFMATQKKPDKTENRWTCCSSVFLEKLGGSKKRIQDHLTVTIGLTTDHYYESLTTENDKNRLLAGTNEAWIRGTKGQKLYIKRE